MPDATGPSADLGRTDVAVAASLGALALVLAALTAVPGVVGAWHDDGLYVIGAKALVEGDGYRVLSLPDAPPQTKYPPVVPALLAPAWAAAAFPANIPWLQAVPVLATAALVASAYLYLVRWGYAARPEAAIGCGLAALSPTFLLFGAMPLTEMPYAVALIAAMWALERERVPGVALGALLALPALIRVMGWVAPLGLGLALVAVRDRRRLPAVLAGALLVLGPWLVWVVAAPASDEVYYTSYAGWFSVIGGSGLRMVALNAWWTWCGLGVLALEGVENLLPALPRLLLAFGVGTLACAWLVTGASSKRVLPWMMWAYLLVVIAWPWPPERFLVPILPLLLAGVAVVAGAGLRRAPVLAFALVALLGISGLVRAVDSALFSRRVGFPAHPRIDHATAARWRSFEAVFAWLRANTPPDAVVASALDPVVFLYADRHGFRPFVPRPHALFYGVDEPPLGTSDVLLERLVAGGAGWVVDLGMPMFAEDGPFRALLEELYARGALETAFVDAEDPRFRVYRVIGAR